MSKGYFLYFYKKEKTRQVIEGGTLISFRTLMLYNVRKAFSDVQPAVNEKKRSVKIESN